MKTVVLIDDDPINNYVNQKFIEKAHPCVFVKVFTEIGSALEYLKANIPQIIFLDIAFPHLDGWFFLKTYSSFENQAKVLILTSSIDPTDKEKALGFNCVGGFIIKPLNTLITRNELEKV